MSNYWVHINRLLIKLQVQEMWIERETNVLLHLHTALEPLSHWNMNKAQITHTVWSITVIHWSPPPSSVEFLITISDVHDQQVIGSGKNISCELGVVSRTNMKAVGDKLQSQYRLINKHLEKTNTGDEHSVSGFLIKETQRWQWINNSSNGT